MSDHDGCKSQRLVAPPLLHRVAPAKLLVVCEVPRPPSWVLQLMHPGKILMSLWMRPSVPWWMEEDVHRIFQEGQRVAMIGTYDLDLDMK